MLGPFFRLLTKTEARTALALAMPGLPHVELRTPVIKVARSGQAGRFEHFLHYPPLQDRERHLSRWLLAKPPARLRASSAPGYLLVCQRDYFSLWLRINSSPGRRLSNDPWSVPYRSSQKTVFEMVAMEANEIRWCSSSKL